MNMNVKTPTRTYPIIPYRKMGEIDYDSLDFDPNESVEKPDAMLQHREQRAMLDLLDAYFADDGESPDVFVDYDSNICWDPTNLRRHVSPDVYIAFGVDAEAIRNRKIYLPWEVGKPPDFAMEIASPSTAKEDVKDKPRIYEKKIKARELWMHDPSGGRYYKFPLKGFRLVDGKYQEIELTREPDGVLKGYSDVLGVSIAWDDGVPRLYDHASGMYLESVKDMRRARRAAEAQRDAEKAGREAEKARADAAEVRADAFAAQRDMTELQLESAIRTRDAERAAAQSRLEAESEAREAAETRLDASEAENRRLRELIRRIENR